MKITAVNLLPMPELGLKAVKMQKLGQVVLIAGKNGAGKTRFFEKLATWPGQQKHAISHWDSIARNNFELRKADNRSESLDSMRRNFFNANKLPTILDDFTVEGTWPPNFVPFVPKRLDLTLPSTEPRGNTKTHSNNIETALGVDQLAGGTLARIIELQANWREAKHNDPSYPPDECADVIQRYENFRNLIRSLLKTELSRHGQEATLFDRPIEKANLSDGQKVLLQLAVAIHAQGAKLSDVVLLMDEPENHLHPGALLDVVDAILPHLDGGQIWIATHSLPLLAHFDSSSLWWMEDGDISYAGDKPEKVLQGLVGDDERRGKLEVFLGLPAMLASSRFAYQCLLPPAVVDTPAGDPQTNQIATLLEKHRPGEKLRILDFGAGRGRLAADLADGGYEASKLKERVDYIAFDPCPAHRDACLCAIERLHGSSEHRYFNDEKSLRSIIHDKTVDVVVMCNVLHEIEPSEWTCIFSEQNLVRQLLREDGYLLVVEDYQMPVGEKAHQKGFLVLDTSQLRKLFKVTLDDTQFSHADARGDGRLKAHIIPKSVLGRVSSDSRKDALHDLAHMAKTEIKTRRAADPTYKNGRLHQFYVQLFANAQLALEELG